MAFYHFFVPSSGKIGNTGIYWV